MKVFLTGASGFIGSHLARLLVSTGCEVAALVKPSTSLWRLQDVVGSIQFLQADLSDSASIRTFLTEWKPEACIHLAWYAEPGKYLRSPENIPALTSSLILLDELIRSGCQQVVMAGTCAEYDTNMGFLREEGPTHPDTIYAAAKLSLNLIGQQMAAAAGINLAWGRLFYLYGPYEDDRRLVPALIRSLLKGESFPATKGEQIRDYLHVEDVASALWTLAQKKAKGIFNISSGVPITIGQLMETVGGIIGRTNLIEFGKLPYRDWEPMFICGHSQNLRSLGWFPRYNLKVGLTKTVEWWQKQ